MGDYMKISQYGSFTDAQALYVSKNGSWIEVPLGLPPAVWKRPDNWLSMDVSAGQQKIQMLVEVGLPSHPTTARQATVLAQGSYTVDWGDGSAPENYNSNVGGTHQYSGEGLTPLGPNSSQVIVTITPQSGNLTVFSLAQPFVTGKTWKHPALEIVFGPGTLTSTVFSGSTNLEHIVFLSGVTIPLPAGMFQNLSNVQKIEGTILGTGTSAANMFNGCNLLKEFPDVSLPNVTNMSGYFQGCSTMKTLPAHDIAWNKVTNWSTAFSAAYLLEEIPDTWLLKGTLFTSTFSACIGLRRIGYMDVSATTNLASTFASCYTLDDIPPIQPTNCGTWTSTFNGCYGLRRITTNMTGAVTAASVFNNCYSLLEINGLLDWSGISSAANIANAFTGCSALRKVQFASGKGPRFTWSIGSMLDATTLNQIYTDLPTITGQTITTLNCPGANTDDPTIATAKGWTVS